MVVGDDVAILGNDHPAAGAFRDKLAQEQAVGHRFRADLHDAVLRPGGDGRNIDRGHRHILKILRQALYALDNDAAFLTFSGQRPGRKADHSG